MLNPRFDFDVLYDESYYRGRGADPTVAYLEEMSAPRSIRTLEWAGLAKTLGAPDPDLRILDFGCGLGGLTRYLCAHGWNAVGYEDPGFALDWMKSAGLPVIEEIPSTPTFDVIFAVEVVEHLIDPLPVLMKLRQALRPGGRFVITTGNLAKARCPLNEWTYASVPDVHVTFWTPTAWDRALQAAGFDTVKADHRLPAEITQYKILKSLPQLRRSLSAVPSVWRPAANLVDRLYGVSDFATGSVPLQNLTTR